MKYNFKYDPDYEGDYDFSDRHWSQPRKFFRRYDLREEMKWQKKAKDLQIRRLRKLSHPL